MEANLSKIVVEDFKFGEVKKCDAYFDVKIFGADKVGKTSLIIKASENTFSDYYFKKNILKNYDFNAKINGKKWIIKLSEQTDELNFRDLFISVAYQNPLAIFIYDITNEESFNIIKEYLKYSEKNKNLEK